LSRKKLQNDPHFTALTLNDEQRAELQRVTAPAVAEWKANMTLPFSIARRCAGLTDPCVPPLAGRPHRSLWSSQR
jgi:hypothetical protein